MLPGTMHKPFLEASKVLTLIHKVSLSCLQERYYEWFTSLRKIVSDGLIWAEKE